MPSRDERRAGGRARRPERDERAREQSVAALHAFAGPISSADTRRPEPVWHVRVRGWHTVCDFASGCFMFHPCVRYSSPSPLACTSRKKDGGLPVIR